MQHNDSTCAYCDLITTIRLVSILHLIQKQKKNKDKEKKKISLYCKLLGFTIITPYIPYNSVNFIYDVVHYTSVVISLIIEACPLRLPSSNSPLPLLSASGNHKLDFHFYVFADFWNIIDHSTMLVLLDNTVIQYFHTLQKNQHDKSIYDIHSRKVLHNFWLYFLHSYFIPVTFILQLEVGIF